MRSVLGEKTYAFASASKAAYVVNHDMENIMRIKIELSMFTDSMNLFKFNVNYATMTWKRLMIDVRGA